MMINNLYRSNQNDKCAFKAFKRKLRSYLKKRKHFKFIFFLVAVPIVAIEGVIGKKVQLPCDIRSTDNDEISMVLWYKEGRDEPIYR